MRLERKLRLAGDWEAKIGKLSLAPSDVLLVKINGVLTPDLYGKVKEAVQRVTGHKRIMIIDANTDLAVLTAEEIRSVAEEIERQVGLGVPDGE